MKNIKTLLPKDKLDDSNLEKIKLLNDSDLSQITSELLTWTQDANWPIKSQKSKSKIVQTGKI